MRFCLIVPLLLWLAVAPAAAQHEVDYAYAPAHWFTPISLIDDWQKSLVDQEGRLVYDFGPGPYARPKTLLSVGPVDAAPDTTIQTLADPRIPIVFTEHRDGETRWRQSAFALIPSSPALPAATSSDGSFRRLEGLVGSPAWAAAAMNLDPAFRSVAWGTGRSIRYDVRVAAGTEKRVALGFNEVYRKGRITRLMDLRVEGASTQTVDLIETGRQQVPQVVFFEGRDEDGDGWLSIEVTASPPTQDPNVFINGIWIFEPTSAISEADILEGRGSARAETHIDAGMELLDAGHVRMDVLRTELVESDGTLQVRLNTLRPFTVDADQTSLLFDGSPFVVTSPAFSNATPTGEGWLLSFPTGTRQVDVLVIHGRPEAPVIFPDLTEEQRRAVAYWQDAPLPWDRLQVPDPSMQDLLDGSIRTMYQIREVVDGKPQFQPGATVYRGLWYGDGTWSTLAAALLDDQEAAREMLDAMLMYQTPDGRVGVMKPALLHRETAHLIYGLCRYARLHQDWDWLEARWGQLEQAVQYLIDLRAQASADPQAPYYGLFPPGLTDGGIGGVGASYGSIYWGLIAMAEVVRTAQEVGREEATAWETEFQDFRAAFQRAATRDQRRDEHGNLFLPVKMDFDPATDLPQRGQWGLLHALYVGQFLSADDPMVAGTLAMLEAHTEENHVVGVGWLAEGIWPIFEAHRALAYLWLDQPAKAEELLYAFANHAAPTFVWVEEQQTRTRGTRTTGDVPHTMGNVQVVRLVRHLLLLERGANLEVMAGLPSQWLRPGARLSAQALPTFFGPVTLTLEVDKSGRRGTLWLQTPAPEQGLGKVQLDLRAFLEAGYRFDGKGRLLPDHINVPWNHLYHLDFRKTAP